MECLDAQRLISEQLDREPVDPAQLAEAKEHCRSCPDCASYVRTLVMLQKSPLPEAPNDLAERVMNAVSAQIAADAAAKSAREVIAPVAPGERAQTIPERAGDDEVDLERLVTVVKARRNRKAVLAWTAAVVLVFVVSGIGAMAGLRTIFTPAPVNTTAAPESQMMYSGRSGDAALEAAAPTAAEDATKIAGATQNYIVVGQTTYRETGEAGGVEKTTLRIVGSTSTAMGGQTITSRDVYGSDDPDKVYVANDDEVLMAFERVTRIFRGTEYVLVSADVSRYGEWPTLPPGLPAPTNPDGTPEYVSAGTDSQGVTVYRQASGDADAGVAVPPGTAASDPAAGNPNWTWWQPVTGD